MIKENDSVNILYVDRQENKDTVTKHLSSNGWCVDNAETILNAMNKIGIKKYDFVLLDYTSANNTEREQFIKCLQTWGILFAIVSTNGLVTKDSKIPIWNKETELSTIAENINKELAVQQLV